VLAATAEHERRLIGERTKEGMRAAKRKGVQLGRPVVVPEETRRLIVEARERGTSLRSIADELNRLAVPTAHGGSRWYASSVRAVIVSSEHRRVGQAG
jgi:DNA invertase Pin-like site-specific DNA recombinase